MNRIFTSETRLLHSFDDVKRLVSAQLLPKSDLTDVINRTIIKYRGKKMHMVLCILVQGWLTSNRKIIERSSHDHTVLLLTTEFLQCFMLDLILIW